jgi:ankyrin repeat protein
MNIIVCALHSCSKETVKEMVKFGADLEAVTQRGQTCIHIAVDKGRIDVCW